VVSIWGGTYVAAKSAQAIIGPVPLVTFRCAVGVLLLGIGLFATRQHLPRLSAREWWTIAFLGVAGNAGFQLCMVGGLRFTTPTHSAVMVALNPVFAALLSWAWLGERVSRRRAAGILLALGGVVLIVTRGGDGTGGTWLAGDLLSLGAALAWAVYSVVGKPLLATHPALEVTTLTMAAGLIPLLPLGLPGLAGIPWVTLGWGTWLLLGYLSVFSQVVSYLLWFWVLARAATAQVVVFSYLTPLVAATISIAVGYEAPTGPLLVGALAVIAGVALAQFG
jgi:drug/metabolite transporter (DMT)-like permease